MPIIEELCHQHIARWCSIHLLGIL